MRARARPSCRVILPTRRSRTRGVAAQHASLSRWRSPVRIRSGPPYRISLRPVRPPGRGVLCPLDVRLWHALGPACQRADEAAKRGLPRPFGSPSVQVGGCNRFRPTRSPVGTPGVPGALRTAQCRSPGHYAARASHPEQRDPAERARRTWIPSVRPRSGARVACSSRLVPSRRASSSQTASQGGYRPQARHQGGRASRSSCAGSRRGQPPRWRKRRTSGRSSVTGSTPAASTASQPRARRAAIVGASVVMTTQADGEAPASASASVGA